MNILVDVFLVGLMALGLWGLLILVRDAFGVWMGTRASSDRCACGKERLHLLTDSLIDSRTEHSRERCQPLREVIS